MTIFKLILGLVFAAKFLKRLGRMLNLDLSEYQLVLNSLALTLLAMWLQTILVRAIERGFAWLCRNRNEQENGDNFEVDD